MCVFMHANQTDKTCSKLSEWLPASYTNVMCPIQVQYLYYSAGYKTLVLRPRGHVNQSINNFNVLGTNRGPTDNQSIQ